MTQRINKAAKQRSTGTPRPTPRPMAKALLAGIEVVADDGGALGGKGLGGKGGDRGKGGRGSAGGRAGGHGAARAWESHNALRIKNK